jgi:ketosteroid isomerase-like protein
MIPPPETYFSGQTWSSDVREVVERFYDALRSGDEDAIAELVDERFAPGVVARQPESLPFGGSYEGIGAVKGLYATIAAPGSPIDLERLTVADIIESVGESDTLDQVVVVLSLPLRSPPTHDPESHPDPLSALEWWTFEDLRVTEIRTFYWDTAAYAGPLHTTT